MSSSGTLLIYESKSNLDQTDVSTDCLADILNSLLKLEICKEVGVLKLSLYFRDK